MSIKISEIRLSTTLMLLMGLFALGCQSEVQDQAGNVEPSGSIEPAPLVESSLKDVGLADFQELISREGMQVLDVRTDAEVAEGYIASAKHLNIHEGDFRESATKMLDKASPVVVYCRSGGRSSNASAILQELGFKDIYNYTGGMSEWKAEGLPTVTN